MQLTPPEIATNCYNLPGQDSDSPFLEYDLPIKEGESDYCFKTGTEYHLWYKEDMIDSSETDNHGTAFTDIYICPSDEEATLVGKWDEK